MSAVLIAIALAAIFFGKEVEKSALAAASLSITAIAIKYCWGL